MSDEKNPKNEDNKDKNKKNAPRYMREKRLQKERERADKDAVMEGRRQLFGDPKQERPGNIWGPKFVTISLIGIILTGIFVFYLSYTGQVDWRTGKTKGQGDDPNQEQHSILERHKDHPMLAPRKVDSIKKVLNQEEGEKASAKEE